MHLARKSILRRDALIFLLALICSAIFVPLALSAEVRQADSTNEVSTRDYVRLLFDEKTSEPLQLQTSIESLRGYDRLGSFQIDLVSAVHIAEESYYLNLNRIFKDYDGVLYELIADKTFDRSQINQTTGDSPVSLIQRLMKNILGLSFQLQKIDYSARNFIHADMSPDQFSESMKMRGETFSKMMLDVVASSMLKTSQTSPPNLSDLLMLTFSQTRSAGLRRALARHFNDMESMLSALNGIEGSTIISGRNRIALEVAQSQLAEGKRKLAVFYGAAHMPDMKRQFAEALKVKRDHVKWLMAWDLAAQTS